MNRNLLNKFQSQPVVRIQVLCFLVVAILPIIFLSFNIYRLAWDGEWREIREKHQLLAENLASPILNYVTHHHDALTILANTARGKDIAKPSPDLLELTNLTLTGYSGLQSISLLDTDGKIIFIVNETVNRLQDSEIEENYKNETSYSRTLQSKKHETSGIRLSPTTSEPVIILTQPVFGKSNNLIGVIMGELRIDEVERLRRNIHFGVKGHSAIVDSNGHVIAHPNPDWMEEMRDLSHLSVIKEMMAGKTGVTEFYSPFVKQDMVAGYTSVPEVGWGVMVPQPKSEVEDQVSAIMASHFDWILAGFIFAISLAMVLVYWITAPINLLSSAAKNLAQNAFEGELPDISKSAPREIKELGDSFNKLITGLQYSRKEINLLNESLQSRVDDATEELLIANKELQKLANNDFLTSLANRRLFESELADNLNRRSTDDLTILLIDIDNFKDINDQHGHAAGDAILIQLAELLNRSMRGNDLLARYGGDEIAAQLHCSAEIARGRAETIREKVENHEFRWDDNVFNITISIGLLNCPKYNFDDIKKLLEKVDSALYVAKKAGRNVVIEYDAEKLEH